MGGGQDRHVIQMIANASLDVVEDVMRKDSAMFVLPYYVWFISLVITAEHCAQGILNLWTNLMSGQYPRLLHQAVRTIYCMTPDGLV